MLPISPLSDRLVGAPPIMLLFLVCVPSQGWSQPRGNPQFGETVLPSDRAAADAPKRRGPDHPWIELSNLRKGNNGPFPTLDVDYKVTAGNPGGFTLVIKSERGRSTSRVTLFGRNQNTISIRMFGFQGFPDNLEVWAETDAGFGPFDRTVGYKISRSLTLGKVGQITYAREWTTDERAAYELDQKMKAPPPPAPAGYAVVEADTAPLLPGMPVLATWMAEWHEAELISVSPQQITVRWTKPLSNRPKVSTMARSRVAVSLATLEAGRAKPETFEPSIRTLLHGTLPLAGDLVPLTSAVPLVPGTPLKAEWAGRWDTVIVTGPSYGGSVPIVWENHSRRKENRQIEKLAIEESVLERLKQPDAKEQFAKRIENLDQLPTRPARSYAKRLPIPSDCTALEDDLLVCKGTKLKAVWGNRWRSLTVLRDSETGPVECHWEGFGGNWNEWITRSSLIIEKRDKARLRQTQARLAEAPDQPSDASASAPTRVRSTPGEGPAEYEIILESAASGSRIPLARAVMEIVELDLSEALQLIKELPITLKGSLTQAEAKSFQTALEAAGGKARVQRRGDE